MCVIVYKPIGATLSFDTIDKMWARNNDGAGLAYFATIDNSTELSCICEKGFMKLSHLKTRLAELFNEFEDFPIAIHFRNATHGGVNEELTHPFAIDKNEDESLAILQDSYPALLMHNGVIGGYGSASDSDTHEFVTQVLSYVEPVARVRFLNMINGKFLLMQEGTFNFIGGWEYHEGLRVSNTHWLPHPTIMNQYGWSPPSKKTGGGSVWYGKKEEPEVETTDPVAVNDALEKDWYKYCGGYMCD